MTLFATPLPTIPAPQPTLPDRNVEHRHAPRGWQFSRLTDWQRREQFDMSIALRDGNLRQLPTCFGDLL